MLRDESFDEEIFEVETFETLELEDDEDEDLAENGFLGLPFIREQLVTILSNTEKLKWSSVTWSSSLAEMFRGSRDMEKINTKLTADAFRAT